jgi:uncharacterized protein (TIGR02646 family)
MRKIDKIGRLQSFADFLKKNKPVFWKELDGQVRKDTREFILLEEQFLLCGYTEFYIDNEDCHIDHYVKRDLDNRLCYDWNNLIVAVNDDEYGAKYKDGGNGVKNLADYNLIFNPVNDTTQNFFRYTTDGKIHPADNLSQSDLNKAQKTINIFNLNHNSLKMRRKDLMLTMGALKKGGTEIQDLPGILDGHGFPSFITCMIENYLD